MAVSKTNQAAEPKESVVKVKYKTVTLKHRTIFADKDGNMKVTPEELEQFKKMKLV